MTKLGLMTQFCLKKELEKITSFAQLMMSQISHVIKIIYTKRDSDIQYKSLRKALSELRKYFLNHN